MVGCFWVIKSLPAVPVMNLWFMFDVANIGGHSPMQWFPLIKSLRLLLCYRFLWFIPTGPLDHPRRGNSDLSKIAIDSFLNWARKNGTSHQQSIGENEMEWTTSIHLICHLFHLKFPLFSLTGWWWWAWNGDKEPVQRWGWLIFIFNIFNPTSCAEVRLWSVSEAQWLICKKTSNGDGPGMKKWPSSKSNLCRGWGYEACLKHNGQDWMQEGFGWDAYHQQPYVAYVLCSICSISSICSICTI